MDEPTIAMREGLDSAGGTRLYGSDLHVEGMLHARLLLPPTGHGRVLGLDRTEALTVPGVRDVVTWADAPGPWHGLSFFGADWIRRPILSQEPQHAGDPIAALVADTPDAAAHGLAALSRHLQWQPLELTVDPARSEALPGGPIHWSQGDIAGQFGRASHVREDHFTTSSVHAAPLEPLACLVEPTAEGGLIVHKGTPSPYVARDQLAQWLGLEPARIRYVCPPTGGGFGSRTDDLEAITSLLALRTGRPVRLVLTRAEGVLCGRLRHGARLTVRSALDADHTLLGRTLEVWYDTGAHLDLGPFVMLRALRPLVLYRAQAIGFTGHLTRSHRPVGGATRGFGNPQATFAVEMHTAALCRDLGVDPIAWRQRHLVRQGDANFSVGMVDPATRTFRPTGAKVASCLVSTCLERVQERVRDPGRPAVGWLRGTGFACAMHTTGTGRKETARARLTWTCDGVELRCGSPDQGGSGVAGTLAHLAAQELGIPVAQVQVILADTRDDLPDGGAHASSRSYVAGQAVLVACRLLKSRRDAGEPLPLQQASAFTPDTNAPPFAACAAVVDVDPATGQVRPVRLVLAADVGHVLRPTQARGQIAGAAMQGLGMALAERVDFDDQGRLATRGWLDQGLLRAMDAPDVEVELLDGWEPSHPQGLKGAGEIGLIPVAPAVADAVSQALGVTIRDLPLDPQRVWSAVVLAVQERDR